MTGYVKGYEMKNISLKKAQKASFSAALSSSGVPEDIKGKMVLVLEAKGSVYAWYQKNVIAVIYFVERMDDYFPKAEADKSVRESTFRRWINGHRTLACLRLTQAFLSPDAAGRKEEFDRAMIAEARERSIFSNDEKAIEWEGQLQYIKRKQIGCFSLSLTFIYILLACVLIGLVSDITTGIYLGLILGLFFSLYDFRDKSAWETVPATRENRTMASELLRRWMD